MMDESRSARSHRLIAIGASIQAHFGITTKEEADILGEIATADPVKFENLKKKIQTKLKEKEN